MNSMKPAIISTSLLSLSVTVTTIGWAMTKSPVEPGPSIRTLMSQKMAETIDGHPAQATILEISWPPGAVSADHYHPCPTLVYILEGELETQIGDGPVKHYKQGDTFYEPTMALHAKTRNPSEKTTAKVLAIQIHDQNVKELVIPKK